MSSDLEAVRHARTILLTTYKRDGTPVETPVISRVEGDRAFFRSYDKAWKTKRLRNNPHVQVAASTLRGRHTGPLIHARAALLGDEQARIAARALARRHRLLQAVLVPLAHRLMHYQTMHYELRPDPRDRVPARVGLSLSGGRASDGWARRHGGGDFCPPFVAREPVADLRAAKG